MASLVGTILMPVASLVAGCLARRAIVAISCFLVGRFSHCLSCGRASRRRPPQRRCVLRWFHCYGGRGGARRAGRAQGQRPGACPDHHGAGLAWDVCEMRQRCGNTRVVHRQAIHAGRSSSRPPARGCVTHIARRPVASVGMKGPPPLLPQPQPLPAAVRRTSADDRYLPPRTATDTVVGGLTSVFLGATFLASISRSSSNLK